VNCAHVGRLTASNYAAELVWHARCIITYADVGSELRLSDLAKCVIGAVCMSRSRDS